MTSYKAFISGAILVVGGFALTTCVAMGHEAPSGWTYDIECCSSIDCAPVMAEAVTVTPDGWRVVLGVGEHFTGRTVDQIVPFDDPRIRISGDEDFHVCLSIHTGRLLCVYVPPMGF